MALYDAPYLSEEEHTLLDHTGVPGVQSGTTVRPTMFIHLESGWDFSDGILAQLPATEFPGQVGAVSALSLQIGPGVPAPGGAVLTVPVTLYVPDGITAISYMYLWIGNAAGTQVANWSVTDLAVTPSVNARTITAAEWGAKDGAVGTDLVMQTDGTVTSTAGGAFWAHLVVNLATT